jgi:hypothetical protein
MGSDSCFDTDLPLLGLWKGKRMQGDTFSFVVRIWHEAVDKHGNPVAWRGSIEQVGGSGRKYFQDLDGALDFIREEAGIDNETMGNAASEPS